MHKKNLISEKDLKIEQELKRLELEEQKLLNEINKVDEVVVKIKYDYQKLKQE